MGTYTAIKMIEERMHNIYLSYVTESPYSEIIFFERIKTPVEMVAERNEEYRFLSQILEEIANKRK